MIAVTVVCSTAAYTAHRFAPAEDSSATFARWGAAQDLTRATRPLVKGTRSLGGGLIPLANLVLFPGDLDAAVNNYYESL